MYKTKETRLIIYSLPGPLNKILRQLRFKIPTRAFLAGSAPPIKPADFQSNIFWPLRIIILCISVWLSTACTTTSQFGKPSATSTAHSFPTENRHIPTCTENQHLFNCDRQAILSMVGDYHVTFGFDETVIYQPGYTRKPPKRSSGFETIILIEDTGRQISLQHILMMADGSPIKHWRQDWVYELSGHWHYTGDQRYELQGRDPKTIPGSWTQLVYEVNDAPRYAGSGFWQHSNGIASWISGRGLRPLPRREYTTRRDYQLIEAVHRHTITPQGWTHEQDNLKIARAKNPQHGVYDSPLVRERGFNEYRRITGYDFSPALTYWQETAPYWKAARARWQYAFKAGGAIKLAFPADDTSMINAMFEQAEAYRKNPQSDSIQQQLESTFRKFIQTEKLVFSE